MRICSSSAVATRSCSISRPHRIAEALGRRAGLAARTDLNAYRLLNGAADGAPGLAVDRYAGLAVIHADSAGVVEDWLGELQASLAGVHTAYVKVHPSRVSHLTSSDISRLAPERPAWGPPIRDVEVREHGVNYLVRPARGLSVGL